MTTGEGTTENSGPATFVGHVIGKYRVLAEIGAGAMGTVYVAEHVIMGRKAALKVLRPEHSVQPDAVARLFNEARVLAALAHPTIVEVFDCGCTPDGVPYVVMELLDGENLESLLERAGPLPVPVAIEVARQLAAGMAAAHRNGIIHRDLKPSNVFVIRDTGELSSLRIKILDFGLAKLTTGVLGETGANTRSGTIVGTPVYMSPEQCRGAATVDAAADVYALGGVLYALACGRPPFAGRTLGDLIAAHVSEPVRPPGQLRSALPPAFEAIICKALAKSPTDRQRDGAALLAELMALDPALSVADADPAHSIASWSQSRVLRSSAALAAASAVSAALARPAAGVTVDDEAAARSLPPGAVGGRSRSISFLDRPRRRRSWLVAVGALVTLAVVAFASWRWLASRASRSWPGRWEYHTIDGDDPAAGRPEGPRAHVDGQGRITVVWREQQGTRFRLLAARSESSGFAKPKLLAAGDEQFVRAMAFVGGTNGVTMLVWRREESTFTSLWSCGFSPASGWEAPVRLPTVERPLKNMDVAIDDDGTATLVWHEGTDKRETVYVSRREPGKAWGPPERVDRDDNDGGRDGDVAAGSGGEAMIIWVRRKGTIRTLLASKYTRGVGWAAAVAIGQDASGDISQPRLTMSARGEAVAVWRRTIADGMEVVSNRFVPGRGWEGPRVIDVADTKDVGWPEVVVDESGTTVIAWRKIEGGFQNMWGRVFSPGMGWRSTEQLDQSENEHAHHPEITGAPGGRALLVWEERGQTRSDIAFTTFDPRFGWQPPRLIEDVAGPAKLAHPASNGRRSVVTWIQAEGTRLRIKAATAVDETAAPPSGQQR